MKKIFAIFLTILALVGVLCIATVSADEPTNVPAPGTVMRVRRQSSGKEPTFVADYDNFEEGWNEAMELADNTGAHVIVDLYTDWISDEAGRFSDDWLNGSGFKNDTIYFQNGIDFTLNMNGHKIQRRLAASELDGEVMYIDSNADVTINNGTITGGRTTNGAGGIHVNGAYLVLNDVCVSGNSTYMDEEGGGIALYGNSKLVMNGGELADNYSTYRGAGVYLGNSGVTAEFNNVKMYGNIGHDEGTVVYVYGSDCTLKFKQCEIYGNSGGDLIAVAEDNSNLYMDGCDIHDNKADIIYMKPDIVCEHYIEIKNTNFYNNQKQNGYVLYMTDSKIYFENVTIKDNAGSAVACKGDTFGTIKNCTFNNNVKEIWIDEDCVDDITFYNCDFGDSTFHCEVKIVSTDSTGAVMGICVQKADGTLGTLDYYKKLEYGWTDAMTRAQSLKGQDRIFVNLYTDWIAVDGQFTDNFSNYTGFDWDAIHVPQSVRVTLNLNGHKIDRALTTNEANGEVICIDINADVIINDGTITGGWSNNGAGGIHIKDNAKVILNNVSLDGNAVTGDDGAAIALYGGATLIMNGGSISNNFMRSSTTFFDITISPYGALYANGSTVTLNNVTLSDNDTFDESSKGVAIYATKSTITMNECIVSGNAVAKDGTFNAMSVIAGYDSKFMITDTDFTNNATDEGLNCSSGARLFYFEDSRLTLKGGKITQNNPQDLFCFDHSIADIEKVTITDNTSAVIYVDNDSEKVNMTECVFGNNNSVDDEPDVVVENEGTLVMSNCNLGDTTFEDKRMVQFSEKAVGSLFGEGSLAIIIAFVALLTSVSAIVVNVSSKKNKVAAPQKAEEDEE